MTQELGTFEITTAGIGKDFFNYYLDPQPERAPEALKKFMAGLRGESYIKLSDSYRPLVAPVLFAEERSTPKPETAT